MIGFMASHAALDRKAPHGKPCTNCGLCCMATLCMVGRSLYKRVLGPCPALKMCDGTSACGVAANPGDYRPDLVAEHGEKAVTDAVKHLIGAGLGCDARFNGEQPDGDFYKLLDEHDQRTAVETFLAKKMWGIP